MFKSIFYFEMKRWFKSAAFYMYCAAFFLFALFLMASSLGVFDGVTQTKSAPVYVNSPLNVSGFLNALSTLVYFLLPTIIGASIYRDFKYQVHQVLFSYAIDKFSYLAAKFSSALLITIIVVLCTSLGFLTAQILPNVNHQLLGPQHVWSYVQAYLYFVIPNLILFGAIVFALVTFTRNVYIGFIFVIFLFVFNTCLNILQGNMDNKFMVSLIDPFGFQALGYLTKYWTVNEQNVNNIPFSGVILYNRCIWTSVGALILGAVYYVFSFTHSGWTFWKSKKSDRVTKNNFGTVLKVKLPEIHVVDTFWSWLKTSWKLSQSDFKFTVRNWVFIIMMILAVLMVMLISGTSGQLYGTETYPVTWKMLNTTGSVFSLFTILIIYLFSGMMIQRAKTAKMNLLMDATSIPNWALFMTKFFALLKIALLIQLVNLVTSVAYQFYHGFFQIDLGQYFIQLFVLNMMNYVIIILFALFVQSFFKNYYIAFFICLVVMFGEQYLTNIGIEQDIYKFNKGDGFSYSDMNGFGSVRSYVWYKIYWFLFTIVLSGITLLFWRRGILANVKERLRFVTVRFTPHIGIPMLMAAVGFSTLGVMIYRENNVLDKYTSANQQELDRVYFEKNYKKYKQVLQPRIVATTVQMDMYPETRDFNATVTYVLKNKNNVELNQILINYNDYLDTITISGAEMIKDDKRVQMEMFKLLKPLQPGDSLIMITKLRNKPNSFIKDRSPILSNGTFLNNRIFPSIGYDAAGEITDNKVRNKYGLPNKDRMANPTDMQARQNTYISNDADWIRFEAILSTSPQQIAIAPGYLQKEWVANGRRYFHYKMDQKMLNFYSVISANYQVKKEKWNGVSLEIYYQKGHEYNLNRMMASMKKSFNYYEQSYSPYQFKQMRIIEFPRTGGSYAQSFANTVPFSEAIGFIAKVDDENPNAVDYPYSVTAHELAHQWWAHQVIGANVKGSTMLSESMSEYSSLKVLEKTYGAIQMRKFLKESLDHYLRGRTTEHIKENPLMLNENQQYIHYNKGSLVMYAMSDYLGEQKFNDFLKTYISRVAFQEAPFTTSLEFVALLKQHTPDSLQYLIKDMYETITLYDNAIEKATSKKLPNGKYQVDIQFKVSKYRDNDKGKRLYEDAKGQALKEKVGDEQVSSLPLCDDVEIGIFGAKQKQGKYEIDHQIYLAKHKIQKIGNTVSILVDEKPIEVGVDPYNKLIDTDSDDNRKAL